VVILGGSAVLKVGSLRDVVGCACAQADLDPRPRPPPLSF
jgi:hypothetical protein